MLPIIVYVLETTSQEKFSSLALQLKIVEIKFVMVLVPVESDDSPCALLNEVLALSKMK